MVCSSHPNKQASGTCAICGQPFCEECLVNVSGTYYCKEHVAGLVGGNNLNQGYQGHITPPTQGAYPPPPGSYPPPPQYNNYNYYGRPDYYPYKNKVIALLLCIFLGVGGFHRFYVGKIGTGLLWLCTFGFFGIGWIVDIILIASGSFRDHCGYPLV